MIKLINNLKKKNFSFIFIILIPIISFVGSIYQLNQHYDGHHHGIIYSITQDFLDQKKIYKDFMPQYGISFILVNSFFLKLFSFSSLGIYFVTSIFYAVSFILLRIIVKSLTDNEIANLSVCIMFLIHPYVGMPWSDYHFFFFLLLSLVFVLKINNHMHQFISGFFLSIAALEKDSFLFIILFLSFFIFYFQLFLFKFKKNNFFSIYWLMGFLFPIISFIFIIYLNDLLDNYKTNLNFGILLSKNNDINNNFNYIYFLLESFVLVIINLLKLSLINFFIEPYWFFFLLIILANFFYILYFVFYLTFRDNKSFVIFFISLLSISLVFVNSYGLTVQRLATGSFVGIITFLFLFNKFFSLENKSILSLVFVSFLLLGFKFVRSSNNLILPNYHKKYYQNPIVFKFLENKKLTKYEWEQLYSVENLSNNISKYCNFIKHSTILTNDIYFRIILKKNFKVLNYFPYHNGNLEFSNLMFKYFDPNYITNLHNLINRNSIVILASDKVDIENYIPPDSNYYLYDTIKYYGYGMNFIKIYIPTNCNIKKNNHNLITVSTVK